MKQLLQTLRALCFYAANPFDVITLTIVRRYADAQKNYIGELYEGVGREAKMIGASCDNWPLDADIKPLEGRPSICYSKSFLDPLPAATLRVGAHEPENNAKVQEYVGLRRYNTIRVTVLNRFVEYVLEGNVKPC